MSSLTLPPKGMTAVWRMMPSWKMVCLSAAMSTRAAPASSSSERTEAAGQARGWLVDSAGLADALVDVLGGHLACDDVEVRLEAHTAHADGVLDALFVVDRELLGMTWRISLQAASRKHVLDEGFNVVGRSQPSFPGDESRCCSS